MLKAVETTKCEVIFLPVNIIKPNPYQPRKFFERTSLEELANSIREYGVLQPISVRLINGNTYELVAGERRLRASKLAGRTTIPAILVKISDQESAVLAIIENLQRSDLNYLEEAEGYLNLMEDYSFTQEKLAQKIGKNQSTIANKIRILKLSKHIHKTLIENGLTERHARALLKLTGESEQLEAINKIIANDLTVKKTEDLIEKMLDNKQTKQEKRKREVRHCIRDIRIFTNTIKNAVDIMNKSGVKTDYFIEENGKCCEIKIKVVYS